MKRLVAMAVALLIALPAAAEVRVIDGDTLNVHGTKTRLWGIDAPEGKQSCQRDGVAWLCGQEAAKALRELIEGEGVRCTEKDRDRYNRSVAVCFIGGLEINAWMVEWGWAFDYPDYSHGAYADEQEAARRAVSGLWVGEFEMPWEWRKRMREAPKRR